MVTDTERRSAPCGVILAGGLGRRMGGEDKPLRVVAGQTLLGRIAARLGPQCAALALNANGDPERFAAYGLLRHLPVIADPVPDHPGPLAGILAAMEWASARADWVVTAPGDTPFLPDDLVVRLRGAQMREGTDLACAASAGWTHPPVALWPVALRGALREALAAGVRRVEGWTAAFRVATVAWPAMPYDPFFNANTPDDLRHAEAIAALADAEDAGTR